MQRFYEPKVMLDLTSYRREERARHLQRIVTVLAFWHWWSQLL
jgi:hypothetical protein